MKHFIQKQWNEFNLKIMYHASLRSESVNAFLLSFFVIYDFKENKKRKKKEPFENKKRERESPHSLLCVN